MAARHGCKATLAPSDVLAHLSQDVKDKAPINLCLVSLLIGCGRHAVLVLHPVGGIPHH